MKSIHWTAASILVLAFTAPNAERFQSAVRADDGSGVSSGRPIEATVSAIKAVHQALLATERPGVVDFVGPKEGDVVHKGEILARLADAVPKANLEVARLTADSPVEIEYARLLNAVNEVEYRKAVLANERQPNAVTDMEVRRIKLEADKSRLQIEKAEHETRINVQKAVQAEAELKTYWILAPFDGVVTSVKKQKGEAVRQGDPVLEIVNTDAVRVEARVKDVDIWNVKVGSKVAVRLAFSDKHNLPVEQQIFRGQIGFVDVVVELHEARVWAEIPNPDNLLRPGLEATMTILPGPPGAAAVAPATTASPFDGNVPTRPMP
jgi:membrane fusion protein, multidrug efflux system